MIILGSFSEGKETSQPLQGLLELRTGNSIAGFNEGPPWARGASPAGRPALALPPCRIREVQVRTLSAGTAPGALPSCHLLVTFMSRHVDVAIKIREFQQIAQGHTASR